MVYTSVEQYTEIVELDEGKEYNFILENENRSTGAAKMQLHWKTPSIFAKEQTEVNKEKSREVYLPANHLWYDFWTGENLEGGQTIKTDAPIETIPLFVKAGSIIPVGPFIQYSTEKPADPIELRIYTGADGEFTLYEDENDNYNYEKGIFAAIDFKWNDAEKTLVISDRKGEFPGMLKERDINIILISEGHGSGIEITQKPDKVIKYAGKELTVKL
jgi:alpha-D-xyloside xylohydrolase